MRVDVVHRRLVSRPLADVFADLVALGTPGDRIWPAPSMPFRRSPGELRAGVTRETHGVIRAVLEDWAPEQRIVWRATVKFLEGTHAFHTTAQGEGLTEVRHELHADLPWWFTPVWYATMAKAHDRIVVKMLARLDA